MPGVPLSNIDGRNREETGMRLLLSGGGGNVPATDQFFASQIDLDKKVLYIPVAQDESEVSYAECLERFLCKYAQYGVTNIEMCTDLKRAAIGEEYTAIYIGGGNTFKLLKEIRESGFDAYIVDFLNRGGFVYGSSAGSIIFGRDILPTTYEDENDVGFHDSKGLNLVKGYDICCHYGDEEARQYKRNRIQAYAAQSQGTIALPDECAIFVEDDTISFIGSGAVLFDR